MRSRCSEEEFHVTSGSVRRCLKKRLLSFLPASLEPVSLLCVFFLNPSILDGIFIKVKMDLGHPMKRPLEADK